MALRLPKPARSRSGSAIAVLVGILGCTPERMSGPDDEQPVSVMIVSSPVVPSPGLMGGRPGAAGLLSGTYTYVSLPAGTVPQGITAEITNRGAGGTVVAYLSAGGFDPVAVPAQAGDSIRLQVKSLTGALLLNETTVVPAVRPPVLVRTNPPPKKRDVPLNASVVVIFSEPVAPATLTDGSFRLAAGAATVIGSLSLTEGGTRAEFTPGQPLAPGTTYLLSLSNAITGVSGSPLEPATVEFTTAAVAEGIGMSLIAYTGCPNPDATPGNCGLFVMNADGSGIRQLTEARDDNYDSSPSWSPDGREIAFSSFRHCALTGRFPAYQQGGTCGREIYLMHGDGSGIVRLTTGEATAQADFPAWRPDGTTVGYVVTAVPIGSGYGISTVEVESGTVTSLVFSTLIGFGRLAWSPDGARLVFSTSNCCTVSDAEAGLRVMNADGSGMLRITTTRDGFPSWSPDGSRIAFQRQLIAASTSYNLFSVAPDGSGLLQLTTESYPIWPLTPSWSPDGSRIAFKRTNNGSIRNSEIWVMNPDGSGAHLINPGWGNLPAWSPFGTVP